MVNKLIKIKGLWNSIIVLCLLFSLFTPIILTRNVLAADAWYDSAWGYRIKITIDNTKVDGDLTNFPVMVYLDNGVNFTFANAQADGDDIRFTEDDGTTLLKYEREYHTSPDAWYWVKIPTVSSSAPSTYFYMYYGNNIAADGEDATNVWDGSFECVNHMDDDPNTSTVQDSTSNNEDGAKKGAAEPIETTGVIYKAQDYDETNDYITYSIDFSTVYALEVWVRPDAPGSNYPAILGGLTTKYAGNLYWDNTISKIGGISNQNNGATLTDADITAGSWYYIAFTVNDKAQKIYWDDNAPNTQNAAFSPETDTSHVVGCRNNHERYWNGKIEEFRWSSSIRTDEWFKASYHSGDDSLLAYSSEECRYPVVTSCNATSVEETTATICGNITDTGGAATCDTRGFVYGTTTQVDPGDVAPAAAGYDTVVTQAVGGYGVGQFTADVVGLTPGECYYYRAWAHNTCSGYDYSDIEQAFQTKPNPPTNFVATTAAANNIDLSWTVGTGADPTYIRGKLGGVPANRGDGAYSTNVAAPGTTVQHNVGVANQHWYYIAWSGKTDCALPEVLSDAPDAGSNAWSSPQWDIINPQCTGVGRDWAVLTAEVEATTQTITSIGFDYGLTTAYGSDVTKDGVWHDGDIFSMVLRDLTPATPYHFRGKGFSGGWSTSGDATFATLGSPAIYEDYTTGCDTDSPFICSSNWTYQAFTTDSTAHTVEYVRLYVERVGYPGDVTCSIRHATAAVDEPTGLDLTSATLDGNAFSTAYSWQQFEFTDVISLEADSPYAIVLSAPSGDASNYVQWCFDGGGGLADAIAGSSTDGGSTWTADVGGADAMFEIWGYASLQVSDCKVFTGYLEPGDWLVVADTTNTYPPYYNDMDDPSEWFYLQFVNLNTSMVEAAVPCRFWERQPLGIYMSEDEVSDLTWSGNFTARLTHLDGTAYQEYPLSPEDWRGDNLYYLDQWMRTTGTAFESYYGETFVISDADKGGALVLNEVGGVMFIRGIPAIARVRPDMFSEVVYLTPHEEEGWTHAYEEGREWQSHLGTELTALAYDWTESMGMDTENTQVLLGSLFVLLYIVLAVVIAGTALSGWAGIVLAIPFMLAGAYMGIINVTIIAVMASFAFLMLAWNWIVSRS